LASTSGWPILPIQPDAIFPKVVTMRGNIQKFLQDCRAVSAIEYALLGGLIAVVIVVGIGLVGTQVASLFQYVKSQVKQATS